MLFLPLRAVVVHPSFGITNAGSYPLPHRSSVDPVENGARVGEVEFLVESLDRQDGEGVLPADPHPGPSSTAGRTATSPGMPALDVLALGLTVVNHYQPRAAHPRRITEPPARSPGPGDITRQPCACVGPRWLPVCPGADEKQQAKDTNRARLIKHNAWDAVRLGCNALGKPGPEGRDVDAVQDRAEGEGAKQLAPHVAFLGRRPGEEGAARLVDAARQHEEEQDDELCRHCCIEP
jgi:hypothetical protein